MQDLQQLHETYADDGLTVVDILIEHDPGEPPTAETAALWAEELDLTYAVLYDAEQDFAARWNPLGTVPEAFVLDREGRVVWNRSRSEFVDLMGELEAVVVQELAR